MGHGLERSPVDIGCFGQHLAGGSGVQIGRRIARLHHAPSIDHDHGKAVARSGENGGEERFDLRPVRGIALLQSVDDGIEHFETINGPLVPPVPGALLHVLPGHKNPDAQHRGHAQGGQERYAVVSGGCHRVSPCGRASDCLSPAAFCPKRPRPAGCEICRADPARSVPAFPGLRHRR